MNYMSHSVFQITKKSVIDVLSASSFVYVVLQVIQIYRMLDTVVSGWYISLAPSCREHYSFSLKIVCIKYKVLRKFLSFHLLSFIKHIVDYDVLVNTGTTKYQWNMLIIYYLFLAAAIRLNIWIINCQSVVYFQCRRMTCMLSVGMGKDHTTQMTILLDKLI